MQHLRKVHKVDKKGGEEEEEEEDNIEQEFLFE